MYFKLPTTKQLHVKMETIIPKHKTIFILAYSPNQKFSMAYVIWGNQVTK